MFCIAPAQAAGLQVAPYTVNAPADWQKMADAHVDAIITDNPAGLLQWLRSQNPPLHPAQNGPSIPRRG